MAGTLQVSCSVDRPSFSHKFDDHSRGSLHSSLSFKPLFRKFQQSLILANVPNIIKEAYVRLTDIFVDLAFEFIDQPLLPSQSNFAPVEELGEAVRVTCIEGSIPDEFPEGVYIRNGPNPLFGGLKSTKSVIGKSSHTWIEGEGMLHALYFCKERDGSWITSYRNRYVQTDTLKLEKKRNKPAFLPAIEGDSYAVLSAFLLNLLRFGLVDKYLSNTNVFEHSEKFYSISENHIPQEIDIRTLETLGNWDINKAWRRPFTSHPKKAPDTGGLVIMGISPRKPYFEIGVISADGKKLIHKADLKLNRCCLCHELGVTKRYNVIMDFPVTIDIDRLISGGSLIKHDKEGRARIGIMPRYGDADSVQWFEVESSCTFHIINCYEDGDEVVVLACRAHGSVIPGPDYGLNKFEWFSKGFKHISSVEKTDEKSQEGSFFSRAHEWRLNMHSGEVDERNLTGTEYSMDFPIVNEKFVGLDNKFGYTQVVDSNASSISGMAKYGGLAKLYFKERKLELLPDKKQPEEELIKVECLEFPQNTFCTGAAFVAKPGSPEEDGGWIITYTHNEDNNISQVYIVDAQKFSEGPVAKIALSSRVPYGFHGAFMPMR
ncbi:carotenoid 9,10(9',10')-cleavage dioxygenase 1-like [Olea europaea var. sylvestris]|uniref:Carotenoid 9,10(9, 10)-cleavage dioxygenase 1-like n=1 Tax=Olea europaea subsp. europaea TaxID=158383 RepID=A0A8S0SN94_OLEEU|nr:carotenoid 9,10(9',10')-cleavage dioxygenase 1-like [Olea europaea var. sylvestris]CAA2994050.1 carotenoid 9,10(9, 10)-cleavage dioxygenase 1-like [Olea europaea subsp. europaea]